MKIFVNFYRVQIENFATFATKPQRQYRIFISWILCECTWNTIKLLFSYAMLFFFIFCFTPIFHSNSQIFVQSKNVCLMKCNLTFLPLIFGCEILRCEAFLILFLKTWFLDHVNIKIFHSEQISYLF